MRLKQLTLSNLKFEGVELLDTRMLLFSITTILVLEHLNIEFLKNVIIGEQFGKGIISCQRLKTLRLHQIKTERNFIPLITIGFTIKTGLPSLTSLELSNLSHEGFEEAGKFLRAIGPNQILKTLNISEFFRPSEMAYSGNSQAVAAFKKEFELFLKRNKRLTRVIGVNNQLSSVQNDYPWRYLAVWYRQRSCCWLHCSLT